MQLRHGMQDNFRQLMQSNAQNLCQQNQRETARDVQTTVRYAISGFIVLVAGILVYAWAAGDKQLPDRFITLTVGALSGGAGITLLRASAKDKD